MTGTFPTRYAIGEDSKSRLRRNGKMIADRQTPMNGMHWPRKPPSTRTELVNAYRHTQTKAIAADSARAQVGVWNLAETAENHFGANPSSDHASMLRVATIIELAPTKNNSESTQRLFTTVRIGLPPAIPVYRLTYGAASSGNLSGVTSVEASMNELPNAIRYRNISSIIAPPIVTMASVMPRS